MLKKRRDNKQILHAGGRTRVRAGVWGDIRAQKSLPKEVRVMGHLLGNLHVILLLLFTVYAPFSKKQTRTRARWQSWK